MGYMVIEEPFARRPERVESEVVGDWSDTAQVATDLDIGELSWQALDSAAVDLAGLSRLEVDHCHLRNVSFVNAEGTELFFAESVIERSDLSRLQMLSVTECRITGAKLAGTNFSGALIRDSDFDDCVFRMVNLRMAQLQRVAFTRCTIEDVDAYGAEFEDVDFNDSALMTLSIDQVTATRVDLRRCPTIGLTGIRTFAGFLIADHQIFALAPQLADIAGLTIQADA